MKTILHHRSKSLLRNQTKTTVLGMAGVLFLSGLVSATPIVFSGADLGATSSNPRPNSDAAAAAFATAAGSTDLITFESAPVGSFSSLVVAPGVTLTGNQSISNSATSPDALYGYNTTPGGSNFLYIYGGNLTFNFTTSIDAFGAYFTGAQSPEFGTISLTFSDGSSEEVNLASEDPAGGAQYLGFTDAGASISSVTINGASDAFSVDDVSYQMVQPPPPSSGVPDGGSTAAMLGLAMTGLACVRRKLGI